MRRKSTKILVFVAGALLAGVALYWAVGGFSAVRETAECPTCESDAQVAFAKTATTVVDGGLLAQPTGATKKRPRLDPHGGMGEPEWTPPKDLSTMPRTMGEAFQFNPELRDFFRNHRDFPHLYVGSAHKLEFIHRLSECLRGSVRERGKLVAKLRLVEQSDGELASSPSYVMEIYNLDEDGAGNEIIFLGVDSSIDKSELSDESTQRILTCVQKIHVGSVVKQSYFSSPEGWTTYLTLRFPLNESDLFRVIQTGKPISP